MSAVDVRTTHDAPTWSEYVDATCRRYSEGFAHGYAQGYAAAQQDAAAHSEQVRLARGVLDHLEVGQARAKARAEGRWAP